MNAEYYKYQLDSMSFIRTAREESEIGELLLPTLEHANCDITLSIEDADFIRKEVSFEKVSAKHDLVHLPVFKGIMYEKLLNKLKFNFNIDEYESETEIEDSGYFSFGRINNVEKFLNIGEIIEQEPSIDTPNDYLNAKALLDGIFKAAIENYFIISPEQKLQFSKLTGLQMLAHLNRGFMCLPVDKCLILVREFFTQFTKYSTNEFMEELIILILHCPQIKEVANLFAVSKLSISGSTLFINQNCRGTYNYESINKLSLTDILSDFNDPSQQDTTLKLKTETVKNSQMPISLNENSRNDGVINTKIESMPTGPAILMKAVPEAEQLSTGSPISRRKRGLPSNLENYQIPQPKKLKVDYCNTTDKADLFPDFKRRKYGVSAPKITNNPSNKTDHDLFPDFLKYDDHPNTKIHQYQYTKTLAIASTDAKQNCKIGEYIHLKVIGPLNGASVIFAIDQLSGYIKYSITKHVSQLSIEAVKSLNFLKGRLCKSNKVIKNIIYSDKLLSRELNQYASTNINLHFVKQTEEFVLKAIRKVLETTRDELLHGNIPLDSWNYILCNSCFLYNSAIQKNYNLYPSKEHEPVHYIPCGCSIKGIAFRSERKVKGVFLGFAHSQTSVFVLEDGTDRVTKCSRYKTMQNIYPLIQFPDTYSFDYDEADYDLLLHPDIIDSNYEFEKQ